MEYMDPAPWTLIIRYCPQNMATAHKDLGPISARGEGGRLEFEQIPQKILLWAQFSSECDETILSSGSI